MMNRLANTKNPYQGKFKKVLCVCSAGLLRSPSLAWVLSNPPYNCNTRAAGMDNEYALVPVDEVLLEWCEEIVCAEKSHADDLKELFRGNENLKKPIVVLDIPDSYRMRDPKLIAIINDQLTRMNYSGDKKQ